ncbi:ABC transporter ATP-binding protein [Lutispora saccharofermentans]|uniref:ABC transporter ATP-binding protein/permease n=1 Tax=Lutispora saccharofermentans TaxID=3024236 RepID=A0ABT1NG18_9FIRM|nr:ABC transporter ATP-binding protein [Lutispora saccharofermentans]MCQ1530182.1 ABC transporter ATP-binding protein/permease [Lutispora saccharofermentans]
MNVFYEVIKKKKSLIVLYILTGIVISMLSALSIHYFQRLLDGFGAHALSVSTIVIYSLIMVASCAVNYLDNQPDTKIQNFIYLDLKLLALKKMSTINYLDYQKLGMGKLVQQIENGAAAGKNILYGFYFNLVRDIIPNVILSLVFIGMIDLRIMMLVIAGYVIVFFVTNLILKYLYKIKKSILIHEELLNKYLVRGLMELVVFRVNKRFGEELRKSENASEEITDAKTKMVMIHELFFTVFALLVILIKIIVIIYSFISSNLSVGEIVALIAFLDKAYQPIAVFNVLYVQYKLDKVAFERYMDILQLPDDKNLGSGESCAVIEGDIRFAEVDFSYEGNEIFKGLSFHIPPKSTAAFVGESGSGKSTIIKQIAGLIKPDGGRIGIDGKDLSKMNLQSYYDYISYTSQESPVFDGTLKENIVFDSIVPEQDIINVLERVGLKEFYENLPKGLDTQIGERGVMMSGGERQRLALARLYFQKARIVILDEATSAMDNLTEEYVMENLMEFLKDRTTIIVAHRLNTVRNADNIYVLKHGEIAANGRFEDLLQNSSYFKELWNANSHNTVAAMYS